MTQPTRAELTANAQKGLASWYGEELRGKLMANGKRFDPDKLTAASWFYPLGTRVPLSELADVYEEVGRSLVSREGARRRQTITCNPIRSRLGRQITGKFSIVD